MLKLYAWLLLFIILPGVSIAQSAKTNPKTPPSAVFVQIRTGANRLKYYREYSAGEKKIEALKIDITKIMERTLSDFNTNFSFCPVYYFYDTNWHKVVERSFEGVLLDKELKPLQDVSAFAQDTTYFILNYGGDASIGGRKRPSVLASDFHGRLLEKPLPVAPSNDMVDKYREDFWKYRYVSRDSYLEYRGYAKAYSETLSNYYKSGK